MSTGKDEFTNEILPRLFQKLPDAFPEFGFKFIPNKGYVATTGVKITGEEGETGKVYCYQDNIALFKDYTRELISIWDYLKKRDGLTQQETLFSLARLAEYQLSSENLTPEATERIVIANRQAQLWEDANSFFRHCLDHKENAFSETLGAQSIRNYLVNERGYNPRLFLSPEVSPDQANIKIEVGYIPSIRDLLLHLTNEKGYSVEEVQNLIPDTRVGESHRLTIPYRDPSGRIRGMVFRTTTGANPKYLYSAGLEKKSILFNLKAITGNKDLVIVEGVLDALHATAAGIPNVVAIGGSGGALSKEHIESAIKYGAKRITLVLDNDKAGFIGTDQAITRLQSYPEIRTYVAFVDSSHKDLDKLLTLENGIDEAKKVIGNARPAWDYQLDRIISRYADIQDLNESKHLTAKDIDQLLEDIYTASAKYSPLDAEQFINAFMSDEEIRKMGISSSTLQLTAARIRTNEARQVRTKATKDLLTEAQDYIAKDQSDEALTLLQSKSRAIYQSNQADQFGKLTHAISEAELMAKLQQKSNDLRTGYKIEGEELLLPAGAISVIAAPTSHGKTTMLINLALRIAKQTDKSIYLLSYEEDAESVLISTINTYIGTELAEKVKISENGRKSIRSFYLRNGNDQFINEASRKDFKEKRREFFADWIETKRIVIQHVDYSSETLVDAIHYLKKFGNAGAILVDYIQLISKSKGNYASRQVELKDICQDLMNVAIETGLPVVLGAQFNRQVNSPAMLHPTRIGEAGDIERVANLILAFWNNNHKSIVAKDNELDVLNNYDSRQDLIYVELLKNRGGKAGVSGMLSFDGNTGVIDNRTYSPF